MTTYLKCQTIQTQFVSQRKSNVVFYVFALTLLFSVENSYTGKQFLLVHNILFPYFNICPSPRVIMCYSPFRFVVRQDSTYYHTRAWQTLKHGHLCFYVYPLIIFMRKVCRWFDSYVLLLQNVDYTKITVSV